MLDNEIMESVLTEILQEQKAGAQAIQGINNNLKALADTIDSFQKTLGQQQVVVPSSDMRVVQEIVADGVLRIREMVGSQPKNVTRNFRLLLFPEAYAETYYRIVFGRLLFWMMIFVLTTYMFKLGAQAIESSRLIKFNQYESSHSLKAWNYLYRHEKKFRAQMDSVWLRVGDVK
jgi:hypothetical protein